MTWIPRTAGGETEFARVFELRPELHRRYRDFDQLLWSSGAIEPAVLELCRLRIAQILGCAVRVRPGVALSEERVAALEQWRSRGDFTPVERDCLAFAEKFVLDPHGVTDEDAAAVKGHLADPGLIAFVEALALFDGFLRFEAVLGAGGGDPR